MDAPTNVYLLVEAMDEGVRVLGLFRDPVAAKREAQEASNLWLGVLGRADRPLLDWRVNGDGWECYGDGGEFSIWNEAIQ